MAAPTDTDGNNPNPDMRPHIINNSWGGDGGNDWYMELVDNWISFGMFPQFASGNPGSACSAAGSPGDYPQSYSTGGFDINGDLYVNSGRGPSALDGGIKPNISAPAVGVRSSVPGDGFASFTGTSMASPHVAGTIAVLWSAAPALTGDIEGTKAILNQTAIDTENLACGGEPENNNVWGEGKLDALAAIEQAPLGVTGTVEGTVTDSDGQPIAGATVDFVGEFERSATTADDGTYSALLSVGSYEATASAYGYFSETGTVTVTTDTVITQDFTLEAAPTTTVSGTITDGSGHGWPLYVRIEIPEHPDSPFFTNPETGQYSIDLLEGTEYTMEVSAELPGYIPETRSVTAPPDAATQDFALEVDFVSCTTPGYTPATAGITESFDLGQLPGGWEVVDHNEPPNGQVWTFDDPGERGNLTGGEGNFAIVDSGIHGSGSVQNTDLVSPPIDYTLFENPQIIFKTDYKDYSVDSEVAEVDLSLDNGVTWETVWTAPQADFNDEVIIDVPQAADANQARVRFHYEADFVYWWQLDDVLLGELLCVPVESGLVIGHVATLDSGRPFNGAAVTVNGNPEATTETVTTPEDDALDDGFYQLAVAGSGDTEITATAFQYSPSTETVAVVADGVVVQNFQLGSGILSVTPDSMSADLKLGDTATQELEITNVGSGSVAANFTIVDSEKGFDIAGRDDILSQVGAREQRIPGEYSPLSGMGEEGDFDRSAPSDATSDPWMDIADYPTNLMDASAATHEEKVYVVGGIVTPGSILDTLRIYDPGADTWSDGSPMEGGRQKPAVAFVDGLLYVFGGWTLGGTNHRPDIYDPFTDTWSSGSEMPVAYAASGVAVVDDTIYLVGGCQVSCGATDVLSYDTATDTWTEETPYPQAVSWTHCGAIDGKVYCAGGTSGNDSATAAGYVYDPVSKVWSPIPDMPETLWAGASIATPDLLMISGGVADGSATVTNVGYYFDPASGEWDSLPNSNHARFRTAGACGFYKIGGSSGGFNADQASEHLLGFDVCGSDDASWLWENPTEGTIEPGASAIVTVNFDASVPDVDQPGTYSAELMVSDDTPHSANRIPMVMNVTPPDTWGRVIGNIEGLERCDAAGSPLSGATITVDGEELTTDGDGQYTRWLEQGDYTIEIAADGYESATTPVTVEGGGDTTGDLSLRPLVPCAQVTPDSLDFDVVIGDSEDGEVTLANSGAGELKFHVSRFPATTDMTRAELDPVDVAEEASSEDPESGGILQGWEESAPLPGGVTRMGVVRCPGKLGGFYEVGGVGTAGTTDELSLYDAASDSWDTDLTSLPDEGRESPAVSCTEDGRIHVIGGNASGRGSTSTHFVYDIASDTWEVAAPAPRNVRYAASAAWDGKVYLVGGSESNTLGGIKAEVNVYDIATNTWVENAEPLPAPTFLMGYTQRDQYLYVVGGRGEAVPNLETSTLRLDLDSGTWEAGPELPNGRSDMGVIATNTALYAIGGDADGGGPFDATDETTRLELEPWPGGEWTDIDPIPTGRYGLGGVCTDSDAGAGVRVVGGSPLNSAPTDSHLVSHWTEERCEGESTFVPWLAFAPTAGGSVDGDSSGVATVTVDTSELELGEYQAELHVGTNDSEVGTVTIPVTLSVVEEPPPTTTPPTTTTTTTSPPTTEPPPTTAPPPTTGPPTTGPPTTGPPTTEPPTTEPPSGMSFGDVSEDHVFFEDIRWLAESGITYGCN
ncbi:MAG: S8 family serine peptidase, partial [Acidimicrobiia bacterium]|nr:S8 family serine peptidase [Acidimicrobiia bacterium]